MRNLIKADIRRILKKPVFYIMTLICLFGIVAYGCDKEDVKYLIGNFSGSLVFAGSLVTPVYLYFLVFSDDVRYGIFPQLIGGGISRRRVVEAKSLVLLFFFAIESVLFFAAYILRFALNDITPAKSVVLNGVKMVLENLITSFGFLAFAEIFTFWAMNTAAGILVYAVTLLFGLTAVTVLQEKLEMNLESWYYEGLVHEGIDDAAAGQFPWRILLALVVYVGGSILLSTLVLERKELDL